MRVGMRVLATASMLALLAACTHAAQKRSPHAEQSRPSLGEVSGKLLVVGGAAPGTARGEPGVITLDGPSRAVVTTDAAGSYTSRVQPGTYTASGSLRDGNVTCRSRTPATVRSGRITRLDVICDVP